MLYGIFWKIGICWQFLRKKWQFFWQFFIEKNGNFLAIIWHLNGNFPEGEIQTNDIHVEHTHLIHGGLKCLNKRKDLAAVACADMLCEVRQHESGEGWWTCWLLSQWEQSHRTYRKPWSYVSQFDTCLSVRLSVWQQLFNTIFIIVDSGKFVCKLHFRMAFRFKDI